MTRNTPHRFWIEVIAAAVATLLAVVTLISREWIELVFGVDPDNGSGALEWLIVAVFLAIAVSLSLMARHEWRAAEASRG